MDVVRWENLGGARILQDLFSRSGNASGRWALENRVLAFDDTTWRHGKLECPLTQLFRGSACVIDLYYVKSWKIFVLFVRCLVGACDDSASSAGSSERERKTFFFLAQRTAYHIYSRTSSR